MRGFIPAAGLGKRLRPITDNIPKPLADIGGKTLLGHACDTLRVCGARSIGINFCHLAPLGIGYARSFIDPPLHIYRERSPIGAFGGVNNFIKDTDPESLLVHNGDIYFQGLVDIENVSEDEMVLFTIDNGKRDILLDPKDNVLKIGGIRDDAIRVYGYSGIMFIGKNVIEYLRKLHKRNSFVNFIEGVADPVIKQGYSVSSRFLKGFWSDAGTLASLEELQKYILDVDI